MLSKDMLYKNAGDETRRCLYEILEGKYTFFGDDDEEYTDDYLLEYNFKSFSDGLTEYISSHGYSGDTASVEAKTAYIKQKCKENDVPLNPSIVKTWFTDKRPISSERSRENVYKLCFALDMELEEATDFFFKVYFECPFNFRAAEEAVYYYCLNNRKSYAEAQTLNEKVRSILGASEHSEAEYEMTTAIGNDIHKIRSDENFLEYISKHSGDFLISNRTAYKCAKALIKKAVELAKKDCEEKENFKDFLDEEVKAEKLKHYLGKEDNIDLFIFDLLGNEINEYKKEKSFSKAAEFPELIKSNFPLKMHLSKIKNNEKVSYETMRKTLILLTFYIFFEEMIQADDKYKTDNFENNEEFISFVEDIENTLFLCGYPPLYVRNPFDWLIMHCANNPYPLEEFQNAVRRYYFDVVK